MIHSKIINPIANPLPPASELEKSTYPSAAEEKAVLAEEYSQWLAAVLPLQRLDHSEQDGGFEDTGTGWCDGREAAYWLSRLIAAQCWGKAVSVDAPRLAESIRRAARFLVRRQSPDGRLDMIGSYSANEAGFPVPGLVIAYRRLSQADPALFSEVATDLQRFIQRAAEAVLAGSAHTANHRWTAACAPLAAAHSLWPDQRYLKKIEDYLADGIDCDEDGFWYEERSPNYNMVANAGLVAMADYLNRPELLQPVLRNFQFILYMIQPNGELDSSFSHRQDRAVANFPPCAFGLARRSAQLSGDGRLTTLAMEALKRPKQLISELRPVLFEVDEHLESLPSPEPLPTEYDKFFERHAMARIRHGDTSVTLKADPGGHFYDTVRDQWGGVRFSDDWFHFHHGDIVVQSIHLAPAGTFAIQPRTLERLGAGSYRLAGKAPGWTHTLHFRPGSPPCNMGWDLEHSIDVRVAEHSIAVKLKCTAPNALIASLNLWLRPGVQIDDGTAADRMLKAGEIVRLQGGLPLTIRSKTHSLKLLGLPASRHQFKLLPPQPIPSAMPQGCAVLCVGLNSPVDLELNFTW